MNLYSQLPQRGLLLLAGPDTRTFLQGQTTSDFDQLADNGSISGAYCTPQGRMVCDFRAVALNDNDCLLAMHRSICESSAAVLGKYIVFSKSEISDVSDDWMVFALWGEELPERQEGVDSHGAFWCAIDELRQRWEIYCPASTAEQLEAELQGIASQGTENDWQLEEIAAGMGHIEADTQEMFIPQMLNYQATGHISFSKGCYTGQEVVARMHYRGKLKRPMFIANAEAPAAKAGTALFVPNSEQSVGNVVNSADTDSGSHMLVVCTTDAAAQSAHLGAPDGPALSFSELPYSLDVD